MSTKIPITGLDVEVAFTVGFEAGMKRIMGIRDPKDFPAKPPLKEVRAAYMAAFKAEREGQ